MIDLTGRVVDIKRDYRSRKPVVTFEVEEDVDSLAALGTELLKLKIARKKDVRSLDSNSYFHVLARKLAEKLVISEAECKNRLISSYGYPEMYGDEAIIYKTNAPEEYMLQQEIIHSKLVKVSEENDKEIYFYRIYRGSHTYNTQEMAHLIEGTVNECKQQGIETATPQELYMMAQRWGIKYEQSQQGEKGRA